MESRLEFESTKELEKLFFVEGMYYKIDPSRKSYKTEYSLYKCIYVSNYGALLRSFLEDGKVCGEMFVPHGAKRYILSDMNEESLRLAHYQNFINGMKEEAKKHEELATKLRKEVEQAEVQLAAQR